MSKYLHHRQRIKLAVCKHVLKSFQPLSLVSPIGQCAVPRQRRGAAFLNDEILVGKRRHEDRQDFLNRTTATEIGMNIVLLSEDIHEVEHPLIE